MSFHPNLSNLLNWGAVADAVTKGQKVTAQLENGDWVVGTLRALTPAKGDASFVHGDTPLDKAWVRITTVQGWETWVPFRELASRYAEGFVMLDVADQSVLRR